MKKFDWKPKKGSFKRIQENYIKRQIIKEEASPEQIRIAKKYGFDVSYADDIDVAWVKRSGVEKAWSRKSFDPVLTKIAKQVKQVVDKNGGFDSYDDARKAIDKAVRLGKPWDSKSTFEYAYGKDMGWALGNGDLKSTFPNWTIRDLAVNKQISVNLFDAPITLVGLTALSVEINTKFLTSNLIEDFNIFKDPKILFFTPSIKFSSTSETCLYAAA